uniref:Uncharacterized protein n=1 Tax=Daphnia galeata TaxID=27404 RepID=A0A8J2WKS7_9CRUS|nr:unnamed protein product [Daphnia galeata]
MYFSKTPFTSSFINIDENHEIDVLDCFSDSIFHYLIKENSDPIIGKKLVVPKLLQLIDDKSKIIQVETYRQRPASNSDSNRLTEIFIVFQTISEKDGDFWWSLDKFKDHVIVQRSHDKDAVKNNFKGERREGIEIIAEKLEGKGCIREIFTILWINMIVDIKYQRNLSRCESIIPLIMKKITKTRYEYDNSDFKYSALSAEEENPDLRDIIDFLSNVTNWHPLVIAIYLRDIELFDQVQQNGKYKINNICDKFTLLNLAILFSQIEMIQHLLEKMNANPLNRDEMGKNALHMAAKFNGETEIINLLLNHKIEIDQYDASGTTALNYAIMASNTKVVQCLLDKGANPKRFDRNDRSPLHVAAFYTRNTKIIDLLLQNQGKVDINESNKFGLTALHHAAKTSNHKTARHLMERGANVNCRDQRGLTPLHLAAFCAKDMDMIDLFLNNKKVDLHCCDEFGQNVVAYAKKNTYELRQQIIDRLNEKDGGIIKEYNLLKQTNSEMNMLWRFSVSLLKFFRNRRPEPTFFFVPFADLKPGKGCEISESALIRYVANGKDETIHQMNWDESETPGELNILNNIDRCSKISEVQIYQSAPNYFFNFEPFIIFKTTSEKEGEYWWSLEKNVDCIVLQRSRNEYDVKGANGQGQSRCTALVPRLLPCKYKGKERNQVKTIAENLKGKGTIQDVFARLWTYQVVEEKYSNSHSLPFVTFVCEHITEIGYESPFDPKSDRKPVVENLIHFLSSSLSNWHPLFLPICLGNTQMYDRMKKMTQFNQFNLLTSLNLAIALPNQTEMIKHLLEKKDVDPTLRDGLGRNALEMAAIHADNTDIIDLLLKHKKVKINKRDESGRSALHFAVASSYVVAVRHLMERGAKLDMFDNLGFSPLHLAAFHSNNTIVIELIFQAQKKKGIIIGINIVDDRVGTTALHTAAIASNDVTTEYLIKKGANPNIKDKFGRTPLHLAAFFAKDMKIIHVLLSDKTVDANVLDNDGQNALYYAESNENGLSKEIISRLNKKGVKKRMASFNRNALNIEKQYCNKDEIDQLFSAIQSKSTQQSKSTFKTPTEFILNFLNKLVLLCLASGLGIVVTSNTIDKFY